MTRSPFVARLLALTLVSGLAACGQDEPQPQVAPIVSLTAEPLPPSPRPSPTPSPSPSPTAEAETTTEEPSPEPTAPGASEAARFVSDYRPDDSRDLDHVALDLDADGIDEIVFTYVAGGMARVDIAWWSPEEGYAIGSRGEGGAGSAVDAVRIGDINADLRIEIVTFQSDDKGSSLSVWALTERRDLVGLRAQGGCDDGAYTYGVVGAELHDVDGDGVDEIVATCDDSPLPVRAWSEDTYRWDGEAYAVVPEVVPSGPPDGPPGQDDDGDDGDG